MPRTTAKFRLGSLVRVTRPHATDIVPMRVGRVYTVIGIEPATHGRHCWYTLRRRHGVAHALYRSDRLRPADAPRWVSRGQSRGERARVG